ncbi:MAG: hypothetical protein WC935_01060 [Thermoleophilia bacterium]
MRVLFLYPNIARNRSPQVGLSSIAGTLKREGHEYRLFDINVRFEDETFILKRKRMRKICELYREISPPFSLSTMPETVMVGKS